MAITFNTKHYLNVRSGYMAPVTLHCSYGDIGEQITFYIYDGDNVLDLGSAVASVHGTRIDGANFGPFVCSITDKNKVTFVLDASMTAVEGSAIAEIVITSGNVTIGTCNFGILVENAVFPTGVSYDSDPSVYNDILTYVQTIPATVKANLREDLMDQIGNEKTARSAGDATLNNQISALSRRVETAISGTTEDSEVIDIRNGYDNKDYTSAGTAVRSQISDIWGALNSAEFSKEHLSPVALGTGGNMTPNNRVFYCPTRSNMPFFNAGDVITWSGGTTLQIELSSYRNQGDLYGSEIGSTGWVTSSLNYTMPYDAYVFITVAKTDGSAFTNASQGGVVTRTTNAFAHFLRANAIQPSLILSSGGNMTPNNRLLTDWIMDCQKGDIVFKTNDNLRFSAYERDSASESATLLSSTGWNYNNIYVVRHDNKALRIVLAKETDSDTFASESEGANSIYILKNSVIGGGGSSSSSGIIARNSDVLPKVYASSYYGHPENWVANANKQFSMLITTDIHADQTRFASAISYLNNIPSLDAGICLGDIIGGNYSEDKTWYVNDVLSSDKPFYTVIGNHDGGNSTQRSISATKAEQLTSYITPTADKIGFTPTKTYYSITNDTYKVVVIILDCYDVPDTLSGTDFVYSRGLNAYSKAQVDWLVSTLGSVPEDYTVMICQHCQYDSQTKVDCVWSSNLDRDFRSGDYTPGSTEINQYNNMIPDIINAWKNRTTISGSYAPVIEGLPTIAVSADFSGLTNPGRFAGYFIGHTHSDIHTYITKYPDQLVFNFTCSANDLGQPTWSDLPRVTGTKMEDCITVVSIDNSTDTVRLVRIGSNITTDMRDRSMFISKFDEAVSE